MTETTFAQQFPDAHTAEVLAAKFDKQPGDIITAAVRSVTRLDVSYNSLTDLTGLGVFPALEQLACDHNALTSLDLTQNPALLGLDCSVNRLAFLNLTSNPALEWLVCTGNQLSRLSASPELKQLYCAFNHLTSLDLSASSKLERVFCYKNQIFHLDLASNPKLLAINCSFNNLTSLDVSRSPALEWLVCTHNPLAAWPTGAEDVEYVSLPALPASAFERLPTGQTTREKEKEVTEKYFDDYVNKRDVPGALRYFADEYYSSGKIGHSRYLVLKRAADIIEGGQGQEAAVVGGER